ncbi:MAG: MarR family transcriptional regulator [Ectothiorhodospiraceae bacterium]|nr:MarR family transcriptional regulator [Ectothiorhodospiraceae bacterium]
MRREVATSRDTDKMGDLPYSKHTLRASLHVMMCSKRLEQTVNDLLRTRYQSSLSRFYVLAQLDHAGPNGLSTKELARRLLASKGNITRLLDRMEADNLIRRKPCSMDRRVSHILMTPAGAALFRSMAKDHESWTGRMFEVLTTEELKTLVELVDRVRAQTIGLCLTDLAAENKCD